MVLVVVAVVAVAAGTWLTLANRTNAPHGTVVVAVAGHEAGVLASAELRLHGAGGWMQLGSISGAVPAAPSERDVLQVTVATGAYDAVALGVDTASAPITVAGDQVEPVLLGIEGGSLIAGGVYAGNDGLNLGLGELSGRFVPMPGFQLTDQNGKPFDASSTQGKDLVVAAFHTTCHETCPLYTALYFQLQKRLPANVMLVEVTTDPTTDTPHQLATYAGEIGATWTFATGTADQLISFWKPFGVELSSGDSHTSTLALIDRHGYVRLVYRGVPQVGHEIPPSLVVGMSAQGLAELASGGDGWGAADVLQSLLTITGPEAPPAAGGGQATDFTLSSTSGGRVSLSSLAGHAVVVNFWATYCPPCRAEMPMLQSQVNGVPGVRLLLVNEGDSQQSATAFLQSIGVSLPALLDSDLAVGRAYHVIALPTTVFVAANGSVASIHVGQLSSDVLAAELSTLASQ